MKNRGRATKGKQTSARSAYAVALAGTLGLLFVLARASAQGLPVPLGGPLVVGFSAALLAGLSAVRPRPRLYFVGAGILLLSLIAFWIRSPEGARVARSLLGMPADNSFGPMELGYGYLVGFPLAFLLLGAGAGHWRLGVAWYVGAGIVFLAMNALTGLLPSPLSASWFFWMAAAWPHFLFVMLGAFEWVFG